MFPKPGLIIYRGQDPIEDESFLNPYPHRMQKHDLRVNSIRLDMKTLSRLHNIKSRNHLKNLRLTFSDFIQIDRHLIKSLAHMPSLKKLALQIDIFDEAGDDERRIAKFGILRQLAKKLFTLPKRIIDLQITLFDLIPIDSDILKQIRRLNKLANLKIIVQELSTADLSCLYNFVSSSRTKKALAHLQSLNIDLAQEKYLLHNSARFSEFSQTVVKINSSLQSYPHPKSSLHFDVLSFKSTVPLLLSMLDSSPHLISLEARLNLAQDYPSLFEKLETLGFLSSLKLTVDGDSTGLSRSWTNFGKILVNLKEFNLFLTNSIQDADIINYTFINTLRLLPHLQQLSLKFDIANFDFDSVYLLTQSISSLSNLQGFKIEFYMSSTQKFPFSSRIPDLFKALSSLEFLRVLHLTFSHLGEYLDNKAFLVLSHALEQLAGLKELKICALSSKVDDQGIIKLSKTLPKCINLEHIHIDLRSGLKIENETLIIFMKSFATLKHLAKLDLSISCYKINLTTYETVILLLNQLRSLCFCRLKFLSPKKNLDVELRFQELLINQHQYQGVCKFFL